MSRVIRRPLALAVFVLALSPAPAAAEVTWLCNPAMAADPCRGDQTTTYYESDGSSTVGTPETDASPPVDCFYVYPTVSNQPIPNALKTPDPEIRSIAKYQAQRFSTRCRMFVPLYRQVTTLGLTAMGQTKDVTPYATAYADVEEAWLSYLATENGGRPFVLIGHSQGSRHFRALIRRRIDHDAAVRGRMVSAIIPGANSHDGDFTNVPPCATGTDTGCVVSYSTYNDTPPDNARYGRSDTDPVGHALDLPSGPQFRVTCTDPAALAGNTGPLRTLVPSEPFAPGVIHLLLLRLYNGPQPTAPTPWLQPRDHYSGRCETSNGANVLMLSSVDGARRLTPSPDATWGTHIVDINIALGDLVSLVDMQTRAWLARTAGKARSHRRGATPRAGESD